MILGAGIAGLGAAHQTRVDGGRAVIFEARDRAGGLLDNFTVDGFRFDTAVHLSFAIEPAVRELFDRVEHYTHQPESLCWEDGVWLKHPAQNNMFPLGIEDKVELISGLVRAPSVMIKNYEDWLVGQYGQEIAARWPLPYTEKYWTVPARCLGTDWVGSRMRKADLNEVLRGAFSPSTPNQYYAKEMRYPKQGGYRAFIDPLIAAAEIMYEHEAVFVDSTCRTVRFANGHALPYGELISTLPLPQLVEMMPNVPHSILEDAQSLYATQVDLISIAFNRPRVSPALWFYIYGQEILASRAYAPDWKSPENVPEGCSSLQFEIYSSRERPLAVSVEDLKRNTVDGLSRMGLAEQRDILFVHHTRLPYANVVFDLGMEARRKRVREWVAAQGVSLAGRFGEWDYLWSNQALLSGMDAARRQR